MIFLRIVSGGSSRLMACPAPVVDLLIFFSGSSRPMMRAPTVGRRVAGIDEGLAIQRIEALGDVAGEFHMLRLILADGDDGGLVQQNVGGHQDGILKQSVADRFLRRGLRLILRHALQPTYGRDARKQPGQFGVRRNGRLNYDARVLRIDADGEQ